LTKILKFAILEFVLGEITSLLHLVGFMVSLLALHLERRSLISEFSLASSWL